MTDDPIDPSPVLDRARVAEAVLRGVRLDLDPAIARAAAKGAAVELTEAQALATADIALAALVAVHPIDGKKWLINANKDWRRRSANDAVRFRALLADQRAVTDRWRATAMNGYVWLLGMTCYWQWHWPRWTFAAVVAVGFGAGALLREWLLRRDRRKAKR